MDGKGYHWVAASDDRTAVRACIEDTPTAHILRDYDPWAKDLVGGMRLEDILRQLAVDVGRIRVREMTRRPPVTLKAGDEAFRAALARHDPLVVLLMMTQVAMAYPYQMVAAAAAPRIVRDGGDHLVVRLYQWGATSEKTFVVCDNDAAVTPFRVIRVRLEVNTLRKEPVSVRIDAASALGTNKKTRPRAFL